MLSLLRDSVPATPLFPRLPCFSTLLIVHALRAIFYPATPVYPLISRFLLQRPLLDTADVPMLLVMLYSSSETSRRERAWMLSFLQDGLRGPQDWAAFHRRHTWDLLAGVFEETSDSNIQKVVLQVRFIPSHSVIYSSLTRRIDPCRCDQDAPRFIDTSQQIWVVDLDRDAVSEQRYCGTCSDVVERLTERRDCLVDIIER